MQSARVSDTVIAESIKRKTN